MVRCDECKHKDNCVCVPYGCDCFELDLEEHDKQIRADAIDECIQAIEDTKSLFDNSTKWTIGEKDKIQNRLRQLKEQNSNYLAS